MSQDKPARWMRINVPSGLVSAATHFVAILVLACITISQEHPLVRQIFHAQQIQDLEVIDEILDELLPQLEPTDAPSMTLTSLSSNAAEELPSLDASAFGEVDEAMQDIVPDAIDFSNEVAPLGDLYKKAGTPDGSTGLGERGKLAGIINGERANSPSDSAVANALKWLAAHQNADGSWSFDHRLGPCQGRCGNPGDLVDCKTGATALGLLPFLGAGQTHKEGRYQKNVAAGLYFLISQMKVQQQGGLQTGDLAQAGGSMYSHGLSAIALCEAYGMTQDRGLMQPAQLALNHIVYAQDPVGGGWRYQPRTAGDTSVVGWQLMALNSGHMAYLNVPPATVNGASKFLDSVQSESGAKYGYTGPGSGSGTTAVGLLCRMYLGWKKDHPGIERGVEFLTKTGPSPSNLYYDYYATQVQLHYGGENWTKWNQEMDNLLVAAQDTAAHQKGSWMMKGDHGSTHGGRLYCTSMATLILEARFRISPIYKAEAAEDDFPVK